jgi:hypothetical protein
MAVVEKSRKFGLPENAAAIYALNPLVILDVFG